MKITEPLFRVCKTHQEQFVSIQSTIHTRIRDRVMSLSCSRYVDYIKPPSSTDIDPPDQPTAILGAENSFLCSTIIAKSTKTAEGDPRQAVGGDAQGAAPSSRRRLRRWCSSPSTRSGRSRICTRGGSSLASARRACGPAHHQPRDSRTPAYIRSNQTAMPARADLCECPDPGKPLFCFSGAIIPDGRKRALACRTVKGHVMRTCPGDRSCRLRCFPAAPPSHPPGPATVQRGLRQAVPASLSTGHEHCSSRTARAPGGSMCSWHAAAADTSGRRIIRCALSS